MKKIVRISSILFVATPLMLLNSPKVEAAQVASIQSNADITFALDNTVTPPVNPTNPSQPVTPNPADPHQPGTAGPLSIDYVSNIHFGSKQIQAGTAIYSAQLDQVQNSTGDLISVPNYVQVTDKRGLNLGWKLSVKQSAQFATSDSTPAVLDNASLTFLAATPNSTQLLSLAPLTVPVTLDPTGAATSPVVTAALSTGMGTWTLAFGSGATAAQGIQLTVPATTKKVAAKQYKTTLTWILDDTPL
ncbi:WxL domain-containing protein [Enterococcus faecalis]|uniref:WxL domain-containing protein n=1 Tax=Enterococcus faecalis TaxID=1351 RepID=UPI001B33DC7C|nr:WxL domain-containing protein [Enterococcus faecalis]MBP4094204.1 WxL domain-containing protein [Enterococcus faecalis]